MNELKMLYIAPEAELVLFLPMEGIAYDDSWLSTASNDEYNGASGPGIGGVGGGDSEEDGDDPTPYF